MPMDKNIQPPRAFGKNGQFWAPNFGAIQVMNGCKKRCEKRSPVAENPWASPDSTIDIGFFCGNMVHYPLVN